MTGGVVMLPEEVAEELGVPVELILAHVRRGRIPGRVIGKSARFLSDCLPDIKAFLDRDMPPAPDRRTAQGLERVVEQMPRRKKDIQDWKPPEPGALPNCGVYFVQAGGDADPIKIGASTNVRSRIRALQGASPVLLRLLNVRPAWHPHELEAELHRRLADHRIGHEWFAPVEPVLHEMRSTEDFRGWDGRPSGYTTTYQRHSRGRRFARRGHIFRRQRKSGEASWGFAVDVQPPGSPRRQVRKSGFRTKGEAIAAMVATQAPPGADTDEASRGGTQGAA